MQGKWLYCSITALLALVLAFQKSVVLSVCSLILFTIILFYKRFTKKQMLIILLLFIVFYSRSKIEINNNHSGFQGTETEFVVDFNQAVAVDGNVLTGYARDSRGEKLAIKYYIHSKKEKDKFSEDKLVGYTCKLSGSLKTVIGSTNPNAFDYQAYLKHQKIHWQLSVGQWSGCEERNGPILIIKKQRQKAINLLEEKFPTVTASLVSALLFGERQILDPSLEKAYQSLGIIHLLAISGANVALYSSMIHYLGVRMGVTREKMIIFLLLYLPLFVYLSGASASVIRAAMMMFFFLIWKRFFHSKALSVDICSIVFIVYVFVSPFVLFDIGFQLSFCVTIGLLLSSNILLKTSSPVVLLLKASFISQLSASPILLYNFYEFSLLSVFVNLIYVPIFSVVVIPLSLSLYFLLLIMDEHANIFAQPVQSIFHILNEITLYIANIPYQKITFGRPSVWMILLILCTIYYFFYKWECEKEWEKKLKSIAPYVLVLTLSYFLSHYSLSGEVTFLDVGQGDSIVMQQGFQKETYVIDTGGTVTFQKEEWEQQKDSFEVGGDVLVPYLKSKGVSIIDKLILTHGDSDHIGGAKALLEAMDVKELVLPRMLNRSSLEDEIIQMASRKNVRVVFVEDGMKWKSKGVTFNVLNPKDEQEERNDNSIVIHVKLGGLYWLFTGDLEEKGEQLLLQRYPELPVDVLKVGHHGSKSSTSSMLLKAYMPKVAIISVGRTNRFGHPHSEVIQRLKEKNIKTFRTDRDGAIIYTFKDEKGTISTHLPYAVLNQ